MSGGFLSQAIIYLTAAVICVPVAKRLGMGSVLGYIMAGIAIGPYLLGFVGKEGEDIMHFAEFGVVMMLFLVGLELEPSRLWKLRKAILGMGLLQVCGTAAFLFITFSLFDFSWQASLAIGFALAMSSTAIVLQSLKEKGLMQTASGQSAFSVLLFQDISVIPILAILPMLALTPSGMESHTDHSLLGELPAWMQTLAVLVAVGLVILAGRYAFSPMLRLVAKMRLRELFTASALLIVIGIAYLMQLVGLSPALGTFLGGLVLANSEYKHELESDIEPFKGLLLGLFFLAVGASIDFALVATNPGVITLIVFGVMLIKAIVLFITGKIFRINTDQNILFSLTLSQVGEFAFVLFSFIGRLDILSEEWIGIMMASTAMTMTLTPLLLLLNERFILPGMGTKKEVKKDADSIEEHNQVIIAGFGHFGSTLGRFLRANGIYPTILDNDSDQVDFLRKMGFKVYYGDATRHDLLESAGASEAKVLIAATGSPETNRELVRTVKKHFPNLKLMVRSKNRFDAYELMDEDLDGIYRESLHTSVMLGVDVLSTLGFRKYGVTRRAQNFIKYDEKALRVLAKQRHNKKQYILSVREQIEIQEQLLMSDQETDLTLNDHAWDSEIMRKAITKQS